MTSLVCRICEQPADLTTGYVPEGTGTRVHATCYGERWREDNGQPPMKGDRNYKTQGAKA